MTMVIASKLTRSADERQRRATGFFAPRRSCSTRLSTSSVTVNRSPSLTSLRRDDSTSPNPGLVTSRAVVR